MSFIDTMKTRMIQKKANDFIKTLDKKTSKEVEQAFLDNKEFQNNEIVLSYIFFKQPHMIRILPLDFQISRLNSNLTMFEYGSSEAKKELVSMWLNDNKFFTNSNAINLSDEELRSYIKLYFQQPKDVAKLFMVDLKNVIEVLSDTDIKRTEEIIEEIKDDLTDRQWEFIVEACPSLIKYASQNIQTKYADDEKYNKYINGEAREVFINKQIELLKKDFSLINTMPIDIQAEYIQNNPYMISLLNKDSLVSLLQYDIDLIKHINISFFKDSVNHGLDVVYGLLSNVESLTTKEIINIFVNKGLLNAKGKLYRFDKNSEDCSYQYTIKLIEVIQKLNIEQIINLIKIDCNYILPYVVPVFYSDYSTEMKEKVIIDSNSRCLNVFRAYYGEEVYGNYYKVINKIYNEYLTNYNKNEYSSDYYCIFDLLKVLFNKSLISRNNVDKVTLFIGMSLLYKSKNKLINDSPTVKLLNELISVAYDVDVDNNKEIYDINSLELFNSKFNFISKELLADYNKYNFLNISSLLFIVKSNKAFDLFKKYYSIVLGIHKESKETLFKACENFHYYIDIMKEVDNVELTEEERINLIDLLASYSNKCNVTNREELQKYDILLLKKIIGELSTAKDVNINKNILCNYLFNRGYDITGNTGLLESDTIKGLCDIYDENLIEDFEINGQSVFDESEVNLFKMIKLMFTIEDNDLLFTYFENLLSEKIDRNIVSVIKFFNKFKKYRLELINNQIVTIDDLEMLSQTNPSIVSKEDRDGVDVYTVNDQDFKVLYSNNDGDGIYFCEDISSLKRNYYGYNSLNSNSSIRFASQDNSTIIKLNKDNFDKKIMNSDFIIILNELNDNFIRIAREKNIKIVFFKG